MAIGDYDQVRDLATGVVQPTGIDLACLVFARPEEIFYRFLRFREWQVSEMSLAAYTARVSQGETDLTAIPAFPARCFRHSAIYVRTDSAIHEPAGLAGRRVGVPAWAQTAGVYARAILERDYGVMLSDIDWYQASLHEPGRQEPVEVGVPDGVSLTRVPDRTLDEMLAARELDAVITARPPRGFREGNGVCRRLMEDYVALERESYLETGIFPIMHLVVLRRDVVDAHPWVAMSLLEALEEAKRRSLARVQDSTVPHFPLPWGPAHAQEARELLGEDFWPYGVDSNRAALEAFLEYAFEQRVSSRRVTCEDLFPLAVQSNVSV